MKIFLLYENKGVPTVFEVEPNYVKGDRFSAKIIETGKSRAFAFSMIYGIYDAFSEVECVLNEMLAFQKREQEISDLSDELEKNNKPLESLYDKYEKTEAQIQRKEDSLDRLYYKDDDLTENQSSRLEKLPAEIDKLRDKAARQYEEIEELERKISDRENSVEAKQQNLDEEESIFRKEKFSEFEAKLLSLDIETREVKPTPTPKTEPKREKKVDTNKSTFFSKIRKLIIG